jgi:hypothetical protein
MGTREGRRDSGKPTHTYRNRSTVPRSSDAIQLGVRFASPGPTNAAAKSLFVKIPTTGPPSSCTTPLCVNGLVSLVRPCGVGIQSPVIGPDTVCGGFGKRPTRTYARHVRAAK